MAHTPAIGCNGRLSLTYLTLAYKTGGSIAQNDSHAGSTAQVKQEDAHVHCGLNVIDFRRYLFRECTRNIWTMCSGHDSLVPMLSDFMFTKIKNLSGRRDGNGSSAQLGHAHSTPGGIRAFKAARNYGFWSDFTHEWVSRKPWKMNTSCCQHPCRFVEQQSFKFCRVPCRRSMPGHLTSSSFSALDTPRSSL